MMKLETILEHLPYSHPFLFVDQLLEVSNDGVRGTYTFSEDHGFYAGHLKDHPVTPGAILTECCAQIGLVCLGIYLVDGRTKDSKVAMSSSEMEFYQPVFPGERVEVISEKVYFRFGKLKCKVKMYNRHGKLICKGLISGMINRMTDG